MPTKRTRRGRVSNTTLTPCLRLYLRGMPPPDVIPQADRDEILGLVYFHLHEMGKHAGHAEELGPDSYLAKYLRGECVDQPHWHAWLRRGF